MEIKAAQVKELRDMTGVAMMDCKKALVEATPISGPAAIETTKSDSLAILLSITFTRLKTLHLFFFTNFRAARVSAVSPDCEIKITNVSLGLSTKDLYLYSEAR